MNDPAHRLFRGFQPKAASGGSLRCSNGLRAEAVSECVFLLREKRAGDAARVSRTLRLTALLIRFVGSIYAEFARECSPQLAVTNHGKISTKLNNK
jgi:hypothetical protein